MLIAVLVAIDTNIECEEFHLPGYQDADRRAGCLRGLLDTTSGHIPLGQLR